MKIQIEDMSNFRSIYELEVQEDDSILSIKKKIVEQRDASYEFKDYEYSVNNTIDEKASFVRITHHGIQLEDSELLKNYNIKNGEQLYCRDKYPEKTKFICKASNTHFEFVAYYPKCLSKTNVEEFKQYLYRELKSNCTISLKKIGSSEYLELKEDDNLPARDVYINFKNNIKFELKGRLHLKDFSNVKIINIPDHNQSPESIKASISPFLITGAFCGLFCTITTSYLFNNSAAETALSHSYPQLSLIERAISFAPKLIVGTATGVLIGFGFSHVFNYLQNSNSANKEHDK